MLGGKYSGVGVVTLVTGFGAFVVGGLVIGAFVVVGLVVGAFVVARVVVTGFGVIFTTAGVGFCVGGKYSGVGVVFLVGGGGGGNFLTSVRDADTLAVAGGAGFRVVVVVVGRCVVVVGF